MKKNIIIGALLLVVGTVTGWLCRGYHFRDTAEVVVQPDTVFVMDTIEIEKPDLKESKVVDTMYVEVRDTVVKNDTTFIALPRESKTYGDERFTAVVSGYKPSLDRLEIYIESQVVTKYLIPEPKKPKMNYLSGGIEAAYMGAFSVPIYLEYERMLHENVGIYAVGMYDLSLKQPGAKIGVRAKFGW